tara:strand:+ start:1470 stop:2522 length:1053 start_codon:yes stop_codon:yes gene_type:complete
MVFTIGFTMLAYLPLLKILNKNKQLQRKQQTPPISIIIPAHNEEENIKEKIENTKQLDYPKNKVEIIVVANGCTDKTFEVAKSTKVQVYESEQGKRNAINKGLEHAKHNFIVITDADARVTPNALKNLSSLVHGNVGAACSFTKLKKGSQWYWKSKNSYQKKDWKTRYQEGKLDTLCTLDGKCMLYNRKHFEKFPKDSLADDFDLTIALRKKGLRSVVDKEVIVEEQPPKTLNEELNQIRRRMGFTLYRVMKDADMLWNSRYKEYGTLILPTRRFLALLFPAFALYILLYLFAFLPLTIALSILILGVLVLLKAPYMPIQLIGVSLAWYDYSTGKTTSSLYWKKINNQLT